MPKYLAKPQTDIVDLNICIPVYKRTSELSQLVSSINKSLYGINYNLYFLLNGSTNEVKQLVLNNFIKTSNIGVILFNENIKEDIFIWPLFNLPQGRFWIIGDDDFIEDNARDAVLDSLKHDLTILNYDLYDKTLDSIVKENYLGRLLVKRKKNLDIKYIFDSLGEKISFISSVIVNSKILSLDSVVSSPKSFAYASLLYGSFAESNLKTKIFFEKKICLKQRGNNILIKDMKIIDDIFINDIRLFYLNMTSKKIYRYKAIKKFLIATFFLIPKLLIASRLSNRNPIIKTFFYIDFLYLFIVKSIIRIIPKFVFNFLRKSLR
jgi:hypothetical protein